MRYSAATRRSSPFRRTTRRAGALLPVLLVAAPLLTLVGEGAAQAPGADDRSAYIRTMATYFQVSPLEVEILLEERLALDEAPVLLLLSRETGMPATALAVSRRSGAGWMALSRRFGLDARQFHVELDDQEVDARVRRSWELFRDMDRGAWGQIELTDEEIITLVHLKVLARHHGVPPGRVLRARAESRSWVEVPRRLSGRL